MTARPATAVTGIRRRMRTLLVALACLAPCAISTAQAPPARAHVTYLSGMTAYLDAGREVPVGNVVEGRAEHLVAEADV